MSGRHQDVDRGWAWVVLAGSFFTRLIIGGLLWTTTVYFVVFLKEFGESRTFTSVIGSVAIAFLHAGSPISTHLIQKLGTRSTNLIGTLLLAVNFAINTKANGVVFLIVTHALFFGLGTSLLNNSALIALTEYFDKYLYFATGLSLAGSGIGIFLFAFFVPLTLDEFGWRGSLLILSGCALQIAICGCVIFPTKKSKPHKKVNVESTKKSISRLKCPSWFGELCTSPSYWCMNFAFLLMAAQFTIVTVFYKDFAISRGLEDRFSWALAGYGAGDLTGRVLTGIVANRMDVCLQGTITQLCATLVLLCHLLITEVIGLTICAFLLGILVGAQVTLFCVLPTAISKVLYVVVLGYVQPTAGFGAFIGPPIAGNLVDVTKSYSWSLVFAASLDLVAAVLLFAIYIMNRRAKSLKTTVKIEEEDDVNGKMLRVHFHAENEQNSVTA